MEIGIRELAEQLKLGEDTLLSIAQNIGIENGLIDDSNIVIFFEHIIKEKQNIYTDEPKDKELQLTRFNEKLKKVELEFESSKITQEYQLKEKLLQDELNHKTKLEELKVKTITTLKDEFLANIQQEYNKVNTKLNEIIQKELKLIEWQQELDNAKRIFQKEKELFESQKERLLSEYKQELEKDKEIFHNKSQEEKVKKLDEMNKKIEQLYRDKENEIQKREDGFIQRESDLKIKENEVVAKGKYLTSQEASLYTQAKEKVDEEMKTLEQELQACKNHNRGLRDELDELRDDLNLYEKFENRDLPQELEDKRTEISRLNNSLKEMIDQKNKLSQEAHHSSIQYTNRLDNVMNENNILLNSNKEVESLKSQNMILTEKLKEIDFHKSENQILQNRLDSMNQLFTQAKEKELRVEDIKREPYLKRELKNEINIKNEIKWLDSMEKNMKEYGVEYPKRLLYSFHTALKSAEYSPLSVLSGVSGTGKSELPKLYSHFGGFNFLAEAVQPTWDSPESMLGYYNTIENKFDSYNILKFLLQTSQSKNDTEFGWNEGMSMILLDEMNLSHIELYFAEFLSKFEQRRGAKGINIDIKLGAGMNYPLPLERNVLWIGTMNEDETTKSLSDKVLDRSFSINFPRPDKLLSRAKLKNLEEVKQFEYLHKDTWNKWVQEKTLFTEENREILNKYKDIANGINKSLTPTGRAIGHRVWQSMEYYINNHPLVIQNINDDELLAKNVKLAFEEQLVQKIMPKLRGIETHGKEKAVLNSIRDILNQDEFKITEDFELSMDNPYGQFIWNSANYLKED